MSLRDQYVSILKVHGLDLPEGRVPRNRSLELLRAIAAGSGGRTAKQAVDAIDRTLAEHPGLEEVFAAYLDSSEHDEGRLDTFGRFEPSVVFVRKVLEAQRVPEFAEVFFGEFPTNDYNALAMSAEGGAICLVNSGLLRFIVNFALSCCYGIRADVKGLTFPPEKDDRFLRGLGSAISGAYSYHFGHDFGYGAELQTEDYGHWSLMVANEIAASMKAFVVAHEFMHIGLGHTDSSRCPLRAVPTPTGDIVSHSRSHQQEFDADRMAQRILSDADRFGITTGTPGVVGVASVVPVAIGGVWFLAGHMFLQAIGEKLGRTAPAMSESHPEPLLRVQELIDICTRKCDPRQKSLILKLLAYPIKFVGLAERAQVEWNKERTKYSFTLKY